MAVLTVHSPHVAKSAHQGRIAAGLAVLPVALLALTAYGPTALHAVAQVTRAGLRAVGAGGAHVSDAPIDVAFAVIIGVVVAAVALAVRERHIEHDHELYDVR